MVTSKMREENMSEEIILDEVERALLKLTVDGKEYRFSDFEKALMRRKEDTVKGKYAKATISKYLKTLLDKGLMEMNLNREYRKVLYRITEEGQLALLEKSLNETIERLASLESITTVLISKPEILEEWRNTTQTIIRGITKAEDLPLEEKIEKVAKTREGSFGAFRKALWNMHQISLKLFAPRSVIENISNGVYDGVYLHVNEDGVIDVISENEPIKHNDIKVISM